MFIALEKPARQNVERRERQLCQTVFVSPPESNRRAAGIAEVQKGVRIVGFPPPLAVRMF